MKWRLLLSSISAGLLKKNGCSSREPLVRIYMCCGAGHWIAELRRLKCAGRRNQIHVKFGNDGRPVLSKQLIPFGVLWWTSQVESNSMDTRRYAFEDTCQNSLTIFVVFLAAEFTIICCLLGRGRRILRSIFIQRKSEHCLCIVVSKVPQKFQKQGFCAVLDDE